MVVNLNGDGILRPHSLLVWSLRRPSTKPLLSSNKSRMQRLLAAYWLFNKKAQEPLSPKPLDISKFFGCGGRI